MKVGLTLTNNNTIDLTGNNALLGHPRFVRASSQYLSRGDEANFDITGTETYIAAAYQGLTFGIWVDMVSLPSAAQFIIAKWNSTGNQRAYALLVNSSNRFQFSISDNGTDGYSIPAAVDAGTSIWYFLAGRFQTATPEINLWVNETEYIDASSIPASIYSSTSAFTIGASGVAGDYLDAYACHAFLCAAALPDTLIQAIYRKTKGLFGY